MKTSLYSVAFGPLIVGIILSGFLSPRDLADNSDFRVATTVSSLGFAGWLSPNSGCIPEGTTEDECFDRPPLPSGSPGGVRWGGNEGNPTGWDEDFGFDDPLGDATPSGDGSEACIPVTNTGGELRGPNGADLGLSGCIELYMCWTYQVWVSYAFSYSTGDGTQFEGGGGYWKDKKICVSYRSVCPC